MSNDNQKITCVYCTACDKQANLVNIANCTINSWMTGTTTPAIRAFQCPDCKATCPAEEISLEDL